MNEINRRVTEISLRKLNVGKNKNLLSVMHIIQLK